MSARNRSACFAWNSVRNIIESSVGLATRRAASWPDHPSNNYPSARHNPSSFSLALRQTRLRFLSSLARRISGSFATLLFLLLLTCTAAAEEAKSKYPQVDVQGFKKWEFRKPTVTPNSQFFSGITHLGYYPSLTGGDLQERLSLKLLGQFAEKISLTGEFEQQPEFPDNFKVKATYDQSEVQFGNLNVSFAGNEFASASKFVDGMLLTTKSDWYEFSSVPSSKLRSNTQPVATQRGNNTRGPYNLGHNSIVEGTDRIELNNTVLSKDQDYQIDYFQGKISFNRILSPADEFRYTYEYTGLLDIFFPVLSKRDFFALQGRLKLRPGMFEQVLTTPEKLILVAEENLPVFTTQEAEARFVPAVSHFPVIEGSEEFVFAGRRLERDVDYRLDPHTGRIEWLWPEEPSTSSPLSVKYEYYKTDHFKEEISGKDSRGPYALLHGPVVPGNIQIKLDRIPLRPQADYDIDFNKGILEFKSNVESSSTISLDYTAFTQVAPPPFPKPRGPQPAISIGTTYLRESARSGTTSLLANSADNLTGQAIINNRNTLYVQHFPLVTNEAGAAPLVIRVGGTALVLGRDYAIPTVEADAQGNARATPSVKRAFVNDPRDVSDGLNTGTIAFFDPLRSLGRSLTATDEVTVSYSFRKSIAGRYQGRGNGTRGFYYVTGFRGIVPGSESVQVSQTGSVVRTLSRNSTPEVQDGDYSINYSDPSPYLFFNRELDPSTNFTVIFNYVPNQRVDSTDLKHSVLGLDGELSVGDMLSVKAALATSSVDQLFIEESASFEARGNGTQRYSLNASADIIDGSEQVVLNGRNRLNRDVDYFINYTRPGLLVFYFVSPTSQDVISVDYRVQSTSGIALQAATRQGAAHKMEWRFSPTSGVRLSGDLKKLQSEFTPLGVSGLGSGSDIVTNRLELTPFEGTNFVVDIKERNDQVGTSKGFLVKQVDQSFALNMRPSGTGTFGLTYRTLRSSDNAATAPGRPQPTQNSSAKYYTLQFQPPVWKGKALSLGSGLNFTRTDTDNNISSIFQRTDFYSLSSDIGFTEKFGVKLGYQVSEPLTQTIGSSEAQAHTKAVDFTTGLRGDLTFGPFQKLAGQLNLSDHNEDNLVSGAKLASTRNANYVLDFVPIAPLAINLNHDRREDLSVVASAANPKSERTSWSGRFNPFSFLNVDYKTNTDDSVQASGATSQGLSSGYGVNYSVLNLPYIKSTVRYNRDDRHNEVLPASANPVRTILDTNVWNAGSALTFIPFGLITIQGDIALQEYRNYTTNVTTETQDLTYKFSTGLHPLPTLELTAAYSKKVTRDLISKLEPPKSVLEGQLSYAFSSWGNLVYQIQDEDNQGEVLGGRLSGLSFQKTTHAVTINLLVPQDNPLVSRLDGRVAWRNVIYADRQTASNSFSATLVSGEFTITF